MKSLQLIVVMAAALAGGCGGGGTATNPTPANFPSVAGSWRGNLLGPAGETLATASLTIEQSSDIPHPPNPFMQRIFGRWNGVTTVLTVSGGFSGGVGTDGQVIVTLETSGTPCNVRVDARLSGNRLSGTFGRTNQQGCTPWLPDPQLGRIELTRE